MKKTIALVILISMVLLTLQTSIYAAIREPIKAPWISREETITLYNELINKKTTAVSGDNGDASVSIGDKPLDTTAYQVDAAVMKANLDKEAKIHPRLYFTAQEFEELKEKVKTPEYAFIFKRASARAEQYYQAPVMAYNPNDSNLEENQRNIGDTIAPLALQYKITGDKKFFDKAREWTVAACTKFPRWGEDNGELAGGHALYGIGLFYDWCYDDLSPEDRKLIRETLIARGSAMNTFATTNPKAWAANYLQNHLWINLCGLATAGLAIYDEEESVKQWFTTASNAYAKTFALLGEDGAGHEGIGYWAYGVEWIVRYLDLSRDFFGVDGYKSPFFKETALYRIYAGLPRNSWTATGKITFDYADARGNDYVSAAPILHRLASEYNDGYAQWYANDYINSPFNSDSFLWRSIMTFNPKVEMKNINDLPTLREFGELGLVMARSDWSGDESYVGFKNGPVLGKKATAIESKQFARRGVGDMAHAHPDNNHFILFANGEMLIRDDGYVKKYTNSHNTLLVDGVGQAGEGVTWFNSNGGAPLDQEVFENDAVITKVVSKESYDYFVADAAKSYKASSGLQKFKRHMIYLKDDNMLIVADDIKTDRKKPLELRFFTESQKLSMASGNTVLAPGKNTNLEVELLTPENVELKTDPVTIAKDRNGGAINRYAIQMKVNQSSWKNVTALKWAYKNVKPTAVEYASDGQNLIFKVEDKTITLNLDTNNIKVSEQPEVKDADATLKSLVINNNPVSGFDPKKFELEYNLDDYARLIRTKFADYEVRAIPTGKRSTVEITMPETMQDILTIKVTSADKSAENTYKVKMTGKVVNGIPAPIAAVTVTGNGPGSTPEMAFDNDYVSYWADDGDGKYIQFDVGSVKELVGLDIAWYKGADRQAKFSVEVSEDGKNWSEVYNGISSGTSAEPEFYEFDHVMKARYLRIIGHGNTEGTYWHSVAETAIYEIVKDE